MIGRAEEPKSTSPGRAHRSGVVLPPASPWPQFQSARRTWGISKPLSHPSDTWREAPLVCKRITEKENIPLEKTPVRNPECSGGSAWLMSVHIPSGGR
jgi:hypothetical protein